MDRLKGKIAIVTGTGSGIGRAIAQRFVDEGASVVVADIAGAEEEAAKLGKATVACTIGVSCSADIQAMIRTTTERFGRLDILVNNAGVESKQAPTADYAEDEFDRVIAINLRGVFLGMQYGIPALLASGGGSIINMASIAALVGFPTAVAYTASKGSVIQMTKTAALEYAIQNVRMNAICPGVIWTPMVERFTGGSAAAREQFAQIEPVKRMGTPKEIAAMALFMASDEASFVTGTALPVAGGYVAQ
ncbi:MAG: SDR family oxidoreductase [Dehalococcoidia bacterium]|nr:SDR family oxidoreductase [Dehalococcoidia bacterium]